MCIEYVREKEFGHLADQTQVIERLLRMDFADGAQQARLPVHAERGQHVLGHAVQNGSFAAVERVLVRVGQLGRSARTDGHEVVAVLLGYRASLARRQIIADVVSCNSVSIWVEIGFEKFAALVLRRVKWKRIPK